MAHLMLVNPKKRKSVKRRKNPITIKRRSLSAVKHHAPKRHKRYKRNPISSHGVMGQIKNASIGAAGALAVDIAMTKLPIPAQFRNGAMLHVAQGLVSLGLGMAVSKFGKNKALGMQLADGGLTVAIYNGLRATVGSHVGLADDLLGYSMAGGGDLLGVDNYMGDYDEQNDMSDYSSDEEGWISPAPLSGYSN